MPPFVPDLPIVAAFTVASVILALTPGPDMTLFLGKTVSQSRAAGFASLAGATTGVIVHSFLVALGLSALLAASATAFTILKVVGAAYLVYLAVDAIRRGSSFTLASEPAREPMRRVYLKGLAIDLLNPKVIVFFVTFLPQFVSPGDPAAAGKMLFLGLSYAVVTVVVCAPLVLFAGHVAACLRRSPRATRVVDWLLAGVLSAFAAKLIFSHR